MDSTHDAAASSSMPSEPNLDQRKKNIAVSNLPATSMPGVARVTTDSAPEENQAKGRISPQMGRPIMRGPLSGSEKRRPSSGYGLEENVAKKPHNEMPTNWVVQDDGLRDVPSFYPLEQSSLTLNNVKPSEIASRISDCCRVMSVQAAFDNDLGTASLTTAEHVEIHLSLWQGTGDNSTIVEAQRRKGSVLAYHKYCRNLLDAAQGVFTLESFVVSEEQNRHVNLVETVAGVETISGEEKGSEDENSLLALEIAASLLKKDRIDARQLGMESLCLLTDPASAGTHAAVIASRVVLFGSVQDENLDDADFLPDELGVREAVLSLVQFGRLGENGDLFEEEEDSDSEVNDHEREYNEHLHNLALAVLANSLETLKMSRSENKPSANEFLEESKEISNRELLSTLLNVLSRAESKPHEACLSAQCLNSLFQASKEAKRKARDLNAKQIVVTALDVGRRTHVKLETETKNVMRELEKHDDENLNDNEDEEQN